MQWQFHADAPIYAQLVEGITRRIVAGTYPPGSRLPSVRDLAMEAGVNPNTMQRALGELERSALVYAQRTSGRFVTEQVARIDAAKQEIASRQLKTFLRSMEELGYGIEDILALIRSAGETREEETT